MVAVGATWPPRWTSAVSISQGVPSTAVAYYYGACVDDDDGRVRRHERLLGISDNRCGGGVVVAAGLEDPLG